jgi:hypothetical protein
MKTLKQVLMQRDNMTAEDAQALIDEAKAEVRAGGDPEQILYQDFGLEPDYFFDLLESP